MSAALGFILLALFTSCAVWDGCRHERRVDAALSYLLSNGESYGIEIVKGSNGILARGTVYVLLRELEEMGLVESRAEQHTPPHIAIPRRLYRLTRIGRAEIFERIRLAAKERGAA